VTPLEVPVFSHMSDKKGKQAGIPSLGITGLAAFAKGVRNLPKVEG